MMDFNTYGIALIPMIIALVKISNMLGVPRRWLPVVAVALGVLGGVFYLAPDNLKEGVLLGLWLGLGAIGMHSGAKNTVFNGNGKGA